MHRGDGMATYTEKDDFAVVSHFAIYICERVSKIKASALSYIALLRPNTGRARGQPARDQQSKWTSLSRSEACAFKDFPVENGSFTRYSEEYGIPQ